MSYLSFEQVNVKDVIKNQFKKEAICLDLGKLLIAREKVLRLVFHKVVDLDAQDVYLVMVIGVHDQILIELANDCKFPRGFPILWIPGIKMQYFGFYPKFENDDKQTPDDQSEFNNIQTIHFFKKWSGFLGQLIFFTINDIKYWTVTSKNSAVNCSPFVEDGKRLFEPFINSDLVDYMIDNNLHVCAEIMSKRDQVHGSKVSSESPIITAIGKGCIYYVDGSRSNICGSTFVEFLDHIQLVNLCVKFGLPCDSAVIINDPKNALDFIKKLSERRDFMTDPELNKFLSEISSGIIIHKGTVNHHTILGDCLEGLVLKITHTNGISSVKKYKFPGYTIRTMLFRTLFENFVFSKSLEYEAKRFSDHWCVTPEGQAYWYKFGLQGFINRLTFKTPDENIGDHIHITESTIPTQDTERQFSELSIKFSTGTIIICIGPIGSGKTSTADHIGSLDSSKYVSIDGDKLGFTMDLVLKFGKERNDYSKWLITKTLMEGKIPVISAGGGIFFSTGKNQKFILRNAIYSTLGIIPKIILMVPGQFSQITQLDKSYDPSKLYDNVSAVRNVVNRRLNTNEWKLDSKFKNVNSFASFISEKSKGNYKFAMQLIKSADRIFGFPIISDKNYGIQKTLNYSSVISEINPMKSDIDGTFSQIRVLTMIGNEVGHITYEFDVNCGLKYSLKKFDELLKICDKLGNSDSKIAKGNLITLISNDKKNSLSVAFTHQCIHDDNSTHITINSGVHQPKEMRNVVKAFKNKDKNIELPIGNSKSINYNFNLATVTPCDIEILGVFGI